MNEFNMLLMQDPFYEDNQLFFEGAIKIGDFVESFWASGTYWCREKYIEQWCEGLLRLLDGSQNSATVTSMYAPQSANFIFWWVFYREQDLIYIQNQALFISELPEKFDESNIYKHIRNREQLDEEGNKISEWVVNVSDIAAYLKSVTNGVRGSHN